MKLHQELDIHLHLGFGNMIYYLFPVSVFMDKNINMVPYGLNLFKNWEKGPSDFSQTNFATTLFDYDPTGSLLSKNLLETDDGKVLVNYIKESVLKFLKENSQITNYDVEVTNMWLNEMTSESVHLKHNHYGHTLSGTFYVETPPPSNKIEFYSLADDIGLQKILKVERWTPSNSSAWWLPVEPGTIVIFPSYLKHGVPQEKFEGLRRSIAFDINLKLNR